MNALLGVMARASRVRRDAGGRRACEWTRAAVDRAERRRGGLRSPRWRGRPKEREQPVALTGKQAAPTITLVNDNSQESRATGSSSAERTRGPDLILHPVRMRIILALAGGGAGTAAELAERLVDVPPATLYRHLNVLHRGGILAIAEERRVRGATERRFVLQPGAASLGPDDLAAATRDDHLRWFATYLAGLLDGFGRYLDRGEPDFVRDGVGYRQVILQITDAEVAELSLAVNAALAPFAMQAPGPGRSPRLLATVLMPADAPAPAAEPRKEPLP